jgi:predicted Ser/Thr protein kinase
MDKAARSTPLPPDAAGAPAGPENDLTGQALGDFRVLRRLGQGGMGQVYLAEQVSLRRKVALKIMRPDLAANATSLKRFEAEALAIARVTHANIVQVYAVGESNGLHYMALEYVDGRNLREYLARKGPPDLALALSIMRQAAAALQRASESGIVHRDIKPENILLTRKGEVKVADFGLSRCFANDQQPLNLTQSGVTLGTPLYMSPEQVQGKPVDPRTDIYSLGATCYHMLAGQPPFRGETAFDVAIQHVQNEPRPLQEVRPDLPPELCAVVHRMMAKDPEQRYPTARDILKDLARLRESLAGQATAGQAVSVPAATPVGTGVAGSGTVAGVASAVTRSLPPPAARRGWLPWAVGASTLLALAVGAALGLRHRPTPTPAAEPPPSGQQVADLAVLPTPREKELLEAVKREVNPLDRPRIMAGLEDRIDLGVLYLEQNRLDEADQFFNELTRATPRLNFYFALGELGHAIVLGLRDRPVESNQIFLKVVSSRGTKPAGDRVLLNNGRLRPWIARALDHNAANATPQQPFPEKELGHLRKIPTPVAPTVPPRKESAEKPAAKGKG